MPQNAARRINRATIVKCAISAPFFQEQLFEITDARKMKSPFFCNIRAGAQKLWKRSAIRTAASRPDAALNLPTAPLTLPAGRRPDRTRASGVAYSESCERDVSKSRFLGAALVPSAGTVSQRPTLFGLVSLSLKDRTTLIKGDEMSTRRKFLFTTVGDAALAACQI